MDPTKFDTLTKTLATPDTRRQALRRIGGALTGALVGGGALTGGLRAFLFPGQALAAGSNRDCALFCTAVFGPGPDRGKCLSDAAHGTGLCSTCGPASPGGGLPPQSICCSRNPSGFCSSYSSATCCGSNQTCQNGQCVATCVGQGGTCTEQIACCTGLFCEGGVCVKPKALPGEPCTSGNDCLSTVCTSGLCAYSAEGQPCVWLADCEPGLICVEYLCRLP